MPTLYSPSKKYFNRNDSSFHGGPFRCFFFFLERSRRRRRGRSFVSFRPSRSCNKPSRMARTHADVSFSLASSSSSSSLFLSLCLVSACSLSIFTGFRRISTEKGFRFYLRRRAPGVPSPPSSAGRFASLRNFMREDTAFGFRGISPCPPCSFA